MYKKIFCFLIVILVMSCKNVNAINLNNSTNDVYILSNKLSTSSFNGDNIQLSVVCSYYDSNKKSSSDDYEYFLILNNKKSNDYYSYFSRLSDDCKKVSCEKKNVYGPSLISGIYNKDASFVITFSDTKTYDSLKKDNLCPKGVLYNEKENFITLSNEQLKADDNNTVLDLGSIDNIKDDIPFLSSNSTIGSNDDESKIDNSPSNNTQNNHSGLINGNGSSGNSTNYDDRYNIGSGGGSIDQFWEKGEISSQVSFCSDSGILKAMSLFNTLITIIKILAPLLIIIFSSIDFFNAILSSDDKLIKNATISLGKKIVLGFVIFLTPTLIGIIINSFTTFEFNFRPTDNDSKYSNCVICLFGDKNHCKSKIIEMENNE